jgi:hypothetical protein
MFYHIDIYDEAGNIDHCVIVRTLKELEAVAAGRRCAFKGTASYLDYISDDNQIALGNRD